MLRQAFRVTVNSSPGVARPCARIAPVALLRAAPLCVGRKSIRSRRPLTRKEPVEKDPWIEVRDETTGQIYWWNTDTDETTALGAPKPTSMAPGPSGVPPPAPQQQQGGGMMSGLGGVMAEGFAFGVGSSVAR